MSTDPGTGGPDRGRPVRWPGRRTLRGRLIAGLLALLLVACAAVGLVSYLALHGALFNQIDQQLTSASQRYAHCEESGPRDGQDTDHGGAGPPGQHPPPCNPGEILGLSPGTFTAMAKDGQVIDSAVTLGHCHLTGADNAVLTALPVDGQPANRTLSSLGDSDAAWRRKIVGVAAQKKSSDGRNAALGSAQAEFFAFNGHEDLWHVDWRARLSLSTPFVPVPDELRQFWVH